MNRGRDWLEQAKADLAHAWACFAAHQAAKAAVQALHMRHGQIAWGHSVAELLAPFPRTSNHLPIFSTRPASWTGTMSPRGTPNAHPAGPAFVHYSEGEAREAVAWATEVLHYCERTSLENRS